MPLGSITPTVPQTPVQLFMKMHHASLIESILLTKRLLLSMIQDSKWYLPKGMRFTNLANEIENKTKKEELAVHMDSMHFNPFPICEESFLWRQEIRKHVAEYHGDTDN